MRSLCEISIAIAGNHKECLHDYVSFRDRQPNVSHQYPKSSLMSTTCVRLPPGSVVKRHRDAAPWIPRTGRDCNAPFRHMGNGDAGGARSAGRRFP